MNRLNPSGGCKTLGVRHRGSCFCRAGQVGWGKGLEDTGEMTMKEALTVAQTEARLTFAVPVGTGADE